VEPAACPRLLKKLQVSFKSGAGSWAIKKRFVSGVVKVVRKKLLTARRT